MVVFPFFSVQMVLSFTEPVAVEVIGEVDIALWEKCLSQFSRAARREIEREREKVRKGRVKKLFY